MAFIHFSKEEIGKPLNEDATNAFHVKLYGKSAITSASSVNPTIIENPEFLRMKEQEQKKENAKSCEKKVCPPTPQRGPIDKQIETRTRVCDILYFRFICE